MHDIQEQYLFFLENSIQLSPEGEVNSGGYTPTGSGRKTVNSQGYSELRSQSKRAKSAIH